MGAIGIGIGIPFKKTSQNWSSYWARQSEVLFFGLYSEISGGQMPNKVAGATDYLTVAGSAGSETYQCPNTAPYIAADTDYIWFKTDASQRTTTTAELIGYDLQRTPVKYGDTSPNAIVAIMILKAGETITGTKRDKMFTDFWLPVMWDDSLSIYGHVKDNRGATQQLWTPEAVTLLSDTFTDADGVHLHDHTMNVGSGWTDVGGTWVIDSNRATQTATATSGYGTTADAGETDVDMSFTVIMPNDTFYLIGAFFRFVDGPNNWVCYLQRTGGANATLTLAGNGGGTGGTYDTPHSTGATKTIRITSKGNVITVYLDGTQRIQVTDAAHNTATRFGLYEFRSTAYNTPTFWDSFLVTSNP